MDLYTKNGRPLQVLGDIVYSRSGRPVGRIVGSKVHGTDGRYVASVVGDVLVYNPTEGAGSSGSFSVGSIAAIGTASRIASSIVGEEPDIPD